MIKQDDMKLVLQLINTSLNRSKCVLEDYSDIEWHEIYNIVNHNQLLGLLYNSMNELSKNCLIPSDIMKTWKESAIFSMLMQAVKQKEITRILKMAEAQGIKFVLFKGCVLADLYPDPMARLSGDIDIFVYPRDKENAIRLIENLGYILSKEDTKEKVYVYILKSIDFIIELHFSLWEDYEGSKIALIDNMDIAKESSLIRINACGLEFFTLGYEEHLVFQVFHIVKHFSLQGVSLRYLVDITLYVNRYIENIDFPSFWHKMDMLGYSEFCETAFNICINYLNMSPEIMNGRKESPTESINMFLEDLFNVGCKFDEKLMNWELISLMESYFSGDNDISQSSLVRKIKILFPSSKDLSRRFSYVNKFKILLPIAWIHRVFAFLIKRLRHKNESYDAKEKLTLVEHRLSLMRKLGLMGGEKK